MVSLLRWPGSQLHYDEYEEERNCEGAYMHTYVMKNVDLRHRMNVCL